MRFRISLKGLKALYSRIEAVMEDDFGSMLAEGVQAASEDAVKLLEEAAPYDAAPDNGIIPGEGEHLIDSFYANEATPKGNALATNTVRTEEPIKFQYVTEGTLTAAPIKPKTKQSLWWPDAGYPRRQVQGQAPNPFQEPLVGEIEANGDEYFAETLGLLKVDLEG